MAAADSSPGLNYFKHELAVVESAAVGPGTRIWAFAHILPGAQIGADCNICDHTFIENDVVIGDRVTIKCGVYVWDGIRLEDDVFVGPNATFTNDKMPRSGVRNKQVPVTTVKAGASLGANSTIMPGITIGSRALVGAGAVVTRDVPPWAIVTGSPARICSFANGNLPVPGSRRRHPPAAPDSRSARISLRRRKSPLRNQTVFPGLRRALSRSARRTRPPDVSSIPGMRPRRMPPHRRRRPGTRGDRPRFAQYRRPPSAHGLVH